VDLVAQPSLRADAEAVADNQHADHQLGINRGTSRAAVEWRQLSPYVANFDERVDRPQKVIRRNMPFERELIEQPSLFDLPMSHHDLQSCLMQRLNQRISCVATGEFFNRILSIADIARYNRMFVRGRRLAGPGFNRQVSVGLHIADFDSCPLKCVIGLLPTNESAEAVRSRANKRGYLYERGYWMNKVMADEVERDVVKVQTRLADIIK
jgi:very-short-patch-repair endonuclease